MRVIRHPTFWAFLVMGLLVVAATVLVVKPGSEVSTHVAKAFVCPELPAGGQVYCENVSVPWPTIGLPCQFGPNVSGIFHAVAFTFQHYLPCGHLIEYAFNGTITEPGGSPQTFQSADAAPLVYVWHNYTSPDGRVLVAWFEGTNVTLDVAP